jgi:hypothetical protein
VVVIAAACRIIAVLIVVTNAAICRITVVTDVAICRIIATTGSIMYRTDARKDVRIGRTTGMMSAMTAVIIMMIVIVGESV